MYRMMKQSHLNHQLLLLPRGLETLHPSPCLGVLLPSLLPGSGWVRIQTYSRLRTQDWWRLGGGLGEHSSLLPRYVFLYFLKIRIAFFMLVSTKTEKRGSNSIVLPRKKECQEYLCETLKKRGVYMWRLINFKRKAGRGANHNERIKINGIFPIFL